MLDIIFFDLMARSECFLFHCVTTPRNARKAAACRTAQSALDGLLSRQSRKFRRSLSLRNAHFLQYSLLGGFPAHIQNTAAKPVFGSVIS